MNSEETQNVLLDEIDPFVNQSRERFDEAELRQLADNIKTNGQLQPGVAWFDAGRNRFVLVCGERRFRALKLAKEPVMALKILRGQLTPGQMVQLNLAENIQRASLNPIERGKGFRRLMQLEGLNASEVAVRMNVSNATVSRDLSLLDLPESIQTKVANGELPASVASHIARLPEDETRRSLVDQYGNGKLNREDVAAEVNRILDSGKPEGGKPPRLTLKLGGLAVSVTAKQADKLTYDTLLSVFSSISKAARSLRDGGTTDVGELASVLKAGD